MRTLRLVTLVVLLAILVTIATASWAVATRTLHVRASISTHHPSQYSHVTAYCNAKDQNGKAISGVKCVFTWHHKTVSNKFTAHTGGSGRASSKDFVGRGPRDFRVWITIRCTWKEQVRTCRTWFIPKGSPNKK